MLPVHLLGNVWGQDWSNIADLVVPAAPAQGGGGRDLTAVLKQRQVSAVEMVRMGERFYTPLGFYSLPATFWEPPLFLRPRDPDPVGHSSAWSTHHPPDHPVHMCTDP